MTLQHPFLLQLRLILGFLSPWQVSLWGGLLGTRCPAPGPLPSPSWLAPPATLSGASRDPRDPSSSRPGSLTHSPQERMGRTICLFGSCVGPSEASWQRTGCITCGVMEIT